MENKIYHFFNKLYKYFKVSIWFWLYLMRGAIIYGVFSATGTLFAVMTEMETNDEDEPRELFAKHYAHYRKLKMVSFIFSIIMILLYIGLIYVNYINTAMAMMFKVIFIYFGSMVIILFAYSINEMIVPTKTLKENLIHSFIKMIKNFFTSMWILIFSVALIIMGMKNLVILIFIVPFIYSLGIKLLLREVKV